jgi:predicted Zn-dependent protease
MVRKLFIYAIAGMSLFFSGCVTIYNPATDRREFILINSPTEAAIGRNMAAELVKTQPLAKSRNLQERARRIGARLAKVSDRQDIEYEFQVLEDKELNAMTLPGGFIYVNQGLMEKLNDDELASVIGHEIGHVAARHVIKKIQSHVSYQILLTVAFTAAGDKGSAKASYIAEQIDILFNLISLSYSRKDEYEADRLGVRYSSRAGFNPNAAISALEKIKQGQSPGPEIPIYLRTHPYIDERIKTLRQIIESGSIA